MQPVTLNGLGQWCVLHKKMSLSFSQVGGHHVYQMYSPYLDLECVLFRVPSHNCQWLWGYGLCVYLSSV